MTLPLLSLLLLLTKGLLAQSVTETAYYGCNTHFERTTIGDSQYWVSQEPRRLANAASQCHVCFGTKLASITSQAAAAGSPGGKQFWVGAYSGDITPGLVFFGNTITKREDTNVRLRFICNVRKSPMPAPAPQPSPAPAPQPTPAPAPQPTPAPAPQPTPAPAPQPTPAPAPQPTPAPAPQPTPAPAPQPTPAPAPQPGACTSTYSLTNIGGTNYYVSFQAANATIARQQCMNCFHTDLANINAAAAFAGSPMGAPFYVGAFAGNPADPGTALVFLGNSITQTALIRVRNRWICGTPAPAPQPTPSPAPAPQPTPAPAPQPTPAPAPQPTPAPAPQPTPAPAPQPTPAPTPQPTPAPQPGCTTTFTQVTIGGRVYFISATARSYAEAQGQCQACLGTNLADISNAGAIQGSPGGLTYYIGAYEGQLPWPGYALLFTGNAIYESENDTIPNRFICNAPAGPQPAPAPQPTPAPAPQPTPAPAPQPTPAPAPQPTPAPAPQPSPAPKPPPYYY